MIDGHVHLERGPYTKEWMAKFIRQAEQMGITELYLLEHTHRFEEFLDLYESIFKDTLVSKEQKEWFYKNPKLKLQEYIDFITQMKKENWPIKIKYGLEVCYFPEKEEFLRQRLNTYNWDFLTGSVHWIEGWGFDNPKTKWSWEYKDVDETYEKYYSIMMQLVNSKLFNTLAHPDSIKCFGYSPDKELRNTYIHLAKALSENNMKTEFSTGLWINYGRHQLGMNRELLKVLLEHNVEIVTVSDAHRPEDVGKGIEESLEILKQYTKR